MQELSDSIVNYIRHHGPMSVETYWTLCLSHPEHGYYIKKDPLGVAGDFTTAPEISQMFGEMIGVWAGEHWKRLGSPSQIHLIECGPGRGTLMADLLRVAVVVPGFDASLHVHLIETSPSLRGKQRETLGNRAITWHDELSTLPDDAPLLVIGNEFLDALPIRQFVYENRKWHERLIGLTEDGCFAFVKGGAVGGEDFPIACQNDIFEYSRTRESVFADLCGRIENQGGASLMIDYGHLISCTGDTFQAVMNHKFVKILEYQGDADLTSHVDFGRLALISKDKKLKTSFWKQKDFLESTGILQRAAQLGQHATPQQAKEIKDALHRLLDPTQMGELFKVMEVYKP